MLDFLIIEAIPKKNGGMTICPNFNLLKTDDIMIRGGDFYAIWDASRNLWSTSEKDAIRLIDAELKKYAIENKSNLGNAHVSYMWDSSSGSIDRFHKFCQSQMRDTYKQLDANLTFSNDTPKREDYVSKQLDYPLEKGSIEAYNQLMSTLYSKEEREKIEWAIGAVVTGASKDIQKFLVLYGAPGTGKGTVLLIIEKLFKGYSTAFEAKALGSNTNVFALEAFKNNPLVAIDADAKLSRIEDNTKLNSLVSHEYMLINEKYKSGYTTKFNSFLFLATNEPVKITDARSGLMRRLIDVVPTGNKVPIKTYNRLIKQIDFELGAIAYHCAEVYKANPDKYETYVPNRMLGATNDFYNFIEDSYFVFKKQNDTTLKQAWAMYKQFCENANIPYPNTLRVFREELKNYFKEYHDTFIKESGETVKNYYLDFEADKFSNQFDDIPKEEPEENDWLDMKEQSSLFDDIYKDSLAQYSTDKGTPMRSWDNVTTTLASIDTSRLHYVLLGNESHIVADFDLVDEHGNKSLELNLKAAKKFPPTYAELSKSGQGIHLHYIYTGDVSKLSRLFDHKIEIKVYTGKASLRRQLTKCNNLPIATISSGLPLKGDDAKMINFNSVQSESGLRALIKRNLRKEIHPGTKPSINFIHTILEEAYNSGLKYDVSDMRNSILSFGSRSTNHKQYCVELVGKMKFKSEEPSDSIANEEAPIVFYDIEIYPNLFVVCWKLRGKENPVIKMINPTPSEVEDILKYRLVGFNCRDYDNHIIYGKLMGYSVEALYDLSQKIIKGDFQTSNNVKFGEAYNISWTDVYGFSSKKQSLKKWEIELGIHHQEMGIDWDKPVPEDKWLIVADYCANDVLATEAVFDHLQADFMARKILADISGGTLNDTTNQLTTKLIFGNNRHPQDEFNYRDMGQVEDTDFIPEGFDEFTRFNGEMRISDELLPYGQPVFPGYEYSYGVSTYRGEKVGEGGYVDYQLGIHGNVAVLDIGSMHPHSAIAEKLFGKYTKRFEDLVNARMYIKHKDFDMFNELLDDKLLPYVKMIKEGDMHASDLAFALKIAINSVYGLTKTSYINAFRDTRNVDNIVAKRGALFMINLKHEVQKRGFIVNHIKTDSIKIPDATLDIINFVMEYGKLYGYEFEHESTYDRMCLVNKAVYIARYKTAEECTEMYGYVPGNNAKHSGEWTATGTQFKVPYIFKTLFSKERIEFKDMCETKQVTKGAIYLDRNESMMSRLTELESEQKLLNRKLTRNKFDDGENSDMVEQRLWEIEQQIEECHDYNFIGRVGSFCPIKQGCGGGVMYRYDNNKYYAVNDTKGYRWLESEEVLKRHKEDDIDKTYYDKLVTEAIEAISFHGNYEWFVSDDPYIGPKYTPDGKPDYVDQNLTD